MTKSNDDAPFEGVTVPICLEASQVPIAPSYSLDITPT